MLSIAIQLIIPQSGGISPLMNAGQWLRALLVTRGSVNNSLITAWLLTDQANTPPGSMTLAAGPCLRKPAASVWISRPVMSRATRRSSIVEVSPQELAQIAAVNGAVRQRLHEPIPSGQ